MSKKGKSRLRLRWYQLDLDFNPQCECSSVYVGNSVVKSCLLKRSQESVELEKENHREEIGLQKSHVEVR